MRVLTFVLVLATAAWILLLAVSGAYGQAPEPRLHTQPEFGEVIADFFARSAALRAELAACGLVRNDTLVAWRELPIVGDEVSIPAATALKECAPPAWNSVWHTHPVKWTTSLVNGQRVAVYVEEFSAGDRAVMNLWRMRHRIGAYHCIVYGPFGFKCAWILGLEETT